jgi:[protein-PII] uridylyltransferase
VSRSFDKLVSIAQRGDHSSRKLDREECLKATQTEAQRAFQHVRELHQDGAGGGTVVRQLSDAADTLLRGVFAFGLATAPNARTLANRVALCALGGYGRAELSPKSDLDIGLIHEGEADDAVQELNDYLIPFLWDTGFTIGYSIHGIRDAQQLAQDDIQMFTRFAQGRHIAGDSTVFARLKLSIRELRTLEYAERFVATKVHERFDGLDENLSDIYAPEPQLKEGAGGLRDFHTAIWLMMAAFEVNDLDNAVASGLITQDENLEVVEAVDFLWRIRNELHFHFGREEDQLTFENQRHVAAAFDYGDPPSLSRFMADYYAAAGRVRNLLKIVADSCHVPVEIDSTAAVRKDTSDGHLVVRNGQLYAGGNDPDWFAHHPVRLMEVIWRCAREQVELSRPTARLIGDNLHLVNDLFRSNAVVRRFFMAIFNRPLVAGHAMRQAANVGLLGHYLPEFAAIEDVIRYKDFHSYPVNEHTLRALEAINDITLMEGPVGRCLREALDHLSDPYILMLTILFHDFGKAQGDIHEEESTRLARVICERIRLDEDDTERIAFLVRHHSLMTTISQYRDIDDDEIVRSFANTVKTEQRLRALFLLSYADLSAVGPGVWTEWKGALLMQLYLRTVKHLLGRAETMEEEFWNNPKTDAIREATPEPLRYQVEDHVKGLGERYFVAFQPHQIAEHLSARIEAAESGLAVRCEDDPVTATSHFVVCTRDRSRLFARIAGCFTARLINVSNAAIFTHDDGFAIDVFTVTDARSNRPLTKNQIADLEVLMRSVLLGKEDVRDQVEQSRRRLFALLQPKVPVRDRVDFDNHSSSRHTVIDIETGDRTGLLYDLTWALAELGLDTTTARIVTDARRVRDSFYVTKGGARIENESEQTVIREGILRAIQPRAAVKSLSAKGE